MVTIKDVAKKAGVSPASVSKVLKDYPHVSLETKQKVRKAVKELGYIPNAYASILSSKSHNRIALFININNERQAIDEINMLYIFGAINKAKDLGMDIVTIFSTSLEDKSPQDIISYFKSQLITGIIFYGLSKDHKKYHQIINLEIFDVVVVDADIVNQRTSAVAVDHYNAQYQIGKKIITEKKAQNILYIAGNTNGYVTEIRMQAIKQLAKDLSVNIDTKYGNFSEKKAKEIIQEHATAYQTIICASDLMAIGAIRQLEKMNLNIPVCGYDGISLTAYTAKNMYTVQQNFYNVSQEAIIEMQNIINKKQTRLVLLDFEITTINYDKIIF